MPITIKPTLLKYKDPSTSLYVSIVAAATTNGNNSSNVDIQIDGTSIVNNGVATIPLASTTNYGVVKIGGGLHLENNYLLLNEASLSLIKAGTTYTRAIVPSHLHESVFYGLAKAAGDSTQSASSNAVGVYTNDAKTAILNMLGVAPTYSPNFEYSISLGRKENTTIGSGSIAVGYQVTASNSGSVAFGSRTISLGSGSYAEGVLTISSSAGSHAEGLESIAAGPGSHAEGTNTQALGVISHTEGFNTIATAAILHVSGQYNIADSYDNWTLYDENDTYNIGDKVKILSDEQYIGYIKTGDNDDDWTRDSGIMNYAEIIGNGTADNSRSNARVLDWNGNERLNGTLYVNCNADSSGGVQVATLGDISSAVVEVIRL